MHPHWETAFQDFRRQVDEIFDELIYRRWATARPAQWLPLLDFHETPEEFIIEVELPGISPDDVRIVINDRTLTIAGERQPHVPEGVVFSRCERKNGLFRRAVDLLSPIIPEKTYAENENGIFRIRVPKQPGQQEQHTVSHTESHTEYVIRVTIT